VFPPAASPRGRRRAVDACEAARDRAIYGPWARGVSLPAGVAGAALHRVQALSTAAARRLASTPQAAAAPPAGRAAAGSRRALWKL